MIPVAMITAPRETNYISLTLVSLFDYGYTDITTFEEPGHGFYRHNLDVKRKVNQSKLGCVCNWLSALSYMDERHESFIICEDDWVFVSKSEPDVVSDYGLISYYCSAVNSNGRGWHTPKILDGTGWCGALCLMLGSGVRKSILEDKESFIRKTLNHKKIPTYLDHTIGTYAKGYQNYTHSPSHIRHIGEESTFASNNTLRGRFHKTRQAAE